MPERLKPKGPVLICPLNWGIGHAARCIPVIDMFQDLGWDVVIAGDRPVIGYLKGIFGETVQYHFLSDVHIGYPSHGRFAIKLLKQLPGLLFAVFREHFRIKKLIKITGAVLLISDNRYGLFSRKIKTVFITHQLFIRAMDGFRWVEPVIYYFSQLFIRRFDACWVPDFEGPINLSGDLSHRRKVPGIYFVGPLSRFASIDVCHEQNPLPETFPGDFILVLLSGPEPQRSIMERILYEQFLASPYHVIFVRGLINSMHEDTVELNGSHGLNANYALFHDGMRLIDFRSLPSVKLAYLIRNARLIICRPGYSTIMDLAVYGKKALLIPTPGQTEQEYLGQRMKEQEWALCVDQKQLNVIRHMDEALQYEGIPCMPDGVDLLRMAVHVIASE